ncbi:MAG: alpha/beta hydrolase [Planctomycetaceae bacterium]|nr:alpha/beta hydrolase [Planctomycetaceae bacterium]
MRSSIRTYLLLLVACGVLQLAALETVLVGAEIRIVRDVAYRPDAETDYERTRCKLDLYLPAETKDAPSILWFHGGSLRFGDKGGAIEQGIGKHFAEEGIIFISANYRLHPQVSYPAYVEDAAAAFAFLHGTIETYGGSPRRIFISGHSAGGYLVAMVGLDPQFLAKSKLSPSDIAGVIPVTGQMLTHSTVRKEQEVPETRPVIDAASPCWHVRRDAPPFLNLAGSEDLPTRAEENIYFISALKAIGHPDATYLQIEGRSHISVAAELAKPSDPGGEKIVEFVRRLSR